MLGFVAWCTPSPTPPPQRLYITSPLLFFDRSETNWMLNPSWTLPHSIINTNHTVTEKYRHNQVTELFLSQRESWIEQSNRIIVGGGWKSGHCKRPGISSTFSGTGRLRLGFCSFCQRMWERYYLQWFLENQNFHRKHFRSVKQFVQGQYLRLFSPLNWVSQFSFQHCTSLGPIQVWPLMTWKVSRKCHQQVKEKKLCSPSIFVFPQMIHFLFHCSRRRVDRQHKTFPTR